MIIRAIPRAALAFVLALVPMAANAAPVLWTLNGITFDDGGTASGSFVYDADTNEYTSINIITTSGTALSGSSYGLEGAFVLSSANGLGVAQNGSGSDLTGVTVWGIGFAPALSNAGGIVAPGENFEGLCDDPSCSNNPRDRGAISGTFNGTLAPPAQPHTAVPTMSTYGLIFTVIGLLIVAVRRLSSKAVKAG